MDGVKPVHTDGARRVADALLRWATRGVDDEATRIYMRGLRDQLEGYIDAMDDYMEEVSGEYGGSENAPAMAGDPRVSSA